MFSSKDNYCSPSRSLKHDGSCLTLKELKMIAQDYNSSFPNNRIRLNQTKQRLHEEIRQKLLNHCNKGEHCWVEQKFLSSSTTEKLVTNFRPKKPQSWYKDRHTWLNTFDILDVMKQYEKLYKNFAFMGVYPIDFQERYPDDSARCIGKVFCDFHVKHLPNKITRFGIVLNLDRHDQRGSHWVALYCNVNPKAPNYGIYYYDSVSVPPCKQVMSFMRKIAAQVEDVNFEVSHNKVQKQTKNSECGMFSMVFLTQMLKEKYNFQYICQNMRKDDDINQIRDILYRP